MYVFNYMQKLNIDVKDSFTSSVNSIWYYNFSLAYYDVMKELKQLGRFMELWTFGAQYKNTYTNNISI